MTLKVCEVCGITSEETKVSGGKRFGCKFLCNKHYKHLSRYGYIKDHSKPIVQSFKKCSVCNNTSKDIPIRSGAEWGYDNLCRIHYRRIKKHGSLEVKERDKDDIEIFESHAEVIIKKRNKEEFRVLIDLEDIEMVRKLKWYITSHGYVAHKDVDGITYLHHFIMGVNGEKGKTYIDHEDRNKLNNRKVNLRITNNQNNSFNKGVARSNTGVIGVSYYKNINKYVATIKRDYKSIRLGKFKNLDDAIKARLEAEVRYFGEYAPQKHLYNKYGISED